MFKSHQKQTFAQQLKNKFSFTSQRDTSLRNSTKKVLPNHLHDEDARLRQSVTDKKSPLQNDYIKSYGAFFLEYSIAAEYNHLRKTRLPGIYVIPSAQDPLLWFGVVFIRQGFYQDGVFRFTLDVPSNYPDGDCPKLTFKPPVYHPFVDPTTGELDLKITFSNWRANVNHLWQILLYVRKIFYKFDTKQPQNNEAAQLFDSDLVAYKEKVKEEIVEMNKKLYEDTPETDLHAIKFHEWDAELYGPVRDKIMDSKLENTAPTEEFDFSKPQLSGLSFVEPGTTLIFSKEL